MKNPSQFTARVELPWEQNAYEQASRLWQDHMQILEDKAFTNDEIHKVSMFLVCVCKGGLAHSVCPCVCGTGRGGMCALNIPSVQHSVILLLLVYLETSNSR